MTLKTRMRYLEEDPAPHPLSPSPKAQLEAEPRKYTRVFVEVDTI